MAEAGSRPWTRAQDWLTLVAGLFMALSPLWVDVDTAGTWAMAIIGLAIAVMALIALAMPGAYIDEWATTVGGIVAFIAPWLFSYSDETGAAWTSWIVGVVVVVSALVALPISREVYRHQHHSL